MPGAGTYPRIVRGASDAPNAMDPTFPPLEPADLRRYSRHLALPEVGIEGQKRLKASGVLLLGAGGLGSPAALYLAAAGVGRIGIVDFDVVDETNLQRQILHGTSDVGRPKVQSAERRLRDLNPGVRVDLHEVRFVAGNALSIAKPYDVVVDGSDNFATRYVVNDACVLLRKPCVHGSIHRFEGQVSVFWAGHGPCYRCLFPVPPAPGQAPSCAEAGVLGVLPGVIGSIQAVEAIKLLLGAGEPLFGRLLLFDALEMRFREMALRRDPACAVCGERPTITELRDEAPSCFDPAPAVDETDDSDVTPDELSARLASGRRPVLLDVRTELEWRICRLEGAVLMPLAELALRQAELDPADEIVVYCHVGGRSAYAAEHLRRAGFRRVRNLAGGIDAWAERMDPSMPRY